MESVSCNQNEYKLIHLIAVLESVASKNMTLWGKERGLAEGHMKKGATKNTRAVNTTTERREEHVHNNAIDF